MKIVKEDLYGVLTKNRFTELSKYQVYHIEWVYFAYKGLHDVHYSVRVLSVFSLVMHALMHSNFVTARGM